MITFEKFCTEVKLSLPNCTDLGFVNLINKSKKGNTNLLYVATSAATKTVVGYTSNELPWVAVKKGLIYEKLSMYLSQKYINNNNLYRSTLKEALEAGQL